MRRIRPGGWAWIGLTAGIVVMDYALIAKNQATMSEVFGNALSHPIKRWPVTITWFVLTLHLFGMLIPRKVAFIKRFDPISGIARALTPKVITDTICV